MQFPAADKRLQVPFVHARVISRQFFAEAGRSGSLRARAVIRCQTQSQFECGNRILVLVEFPENAGAALRCFGIFRVPLQGLLEFVARG